MDVHVCKDNAAGMPALGRECQLHLLSFLGINVLAQKKMQALSSMSPVPEAGCT